MVRVGRPRFHHAAGCGVDCAETAVSRAVDAVEVAREVKALADAGDRVDSRPSVNGGREPDPRAEAALHRSRDGVESADSGRGPRENTLGSGGERADLRAGNAEFRAQRRLPASQKMSVVGVDGRDSRHGDAVDTSEHPREVEGSSL